MQRCSRRSPGNGRDIVPRQPSPVADACQPPYGKVAFLYLNGPLDTEMLQ